MKKSFDGAAREGRTARTKAAGGGPARERGAAACGAAGKGAAAEGGRTKAAGGEPKPPKRSAALDAAVAAAAEVLRGGGLILYPTDTVWGIGCDAANAEAVAKIYALKRSENKHAMLVLCHSAEQIVRYVNRAPGIAFEVLEMATSPLTLILPGATGLAANLIPDEGTLGVRVPDHAFCRQLLHAFGRPIVSTSANLSGEKSPRTLAEVVREIVDGVDYVVDPRFEGRPTGRPSSIIAFGEGGEVRIIRA